MGSIIETLQSLEVAPDDYVYLNYEESVDVWHISDDYIDNAVAETKTASMLARLLATSNITVYSRYEEDILSEMRDNGLLEDYDYEGWFEKYLDETLRSSAYEWDLLTFGTERHDHKRGVCAVSTNLKVLAADLYGLQDDADAAVSGFDVVVPTRDGLLTLAR